ncbi:MAG: hypothetical protein IPO08_19605 [Xanthomonadales bacterium]|nr:hypothetical protein [Xanthomonadales bacterium]
MTAMPAPAPTYDLASFARRIVIAGVKNARGKSDTELKERVMLARECGFMTDEETEFYIAAWGLAEA